MEISTLSEVVMFMETLNTSLKELEKSYSGARQKLLNKKKEAERAKDNLIYGSDPIRLDRAERYIRVEMSAPLEEEDILAINDVIKDLASADGEKLRTHYSATKNYASFRHQGIGWCSNGCGPRHGSVVFSVRPTTLTKSEGVHEDNIEDCIYLLMRLKEGKYMPKGYRK